MPQHWISPKYWTFLESYTHACCAQCKYGEDEGHSLYKPFRLSNTSSMSSLWLAHNHRGLAMVSCHISSNRKLSRRLFIAVDRHGNQLGWKFRWFLPHCKSYSDHIQYIANRGLSDHEAIATLARAVRRETREPMTATIGEIIGFWATMECTVW